MKPYLNLCRCGCDFASVSAFDRHRTGSYEYTFAEGLELDPSRDDGRRCLDADEMLEAGMVPDVRGRGWSLTDGRISGAGQHLEGTPAEGAVEGRSLGELDLQSQAHAWCHARR
jgi:hypothetical protein